MAQVTVFFLLKALWGSEMMNFTEKNTHTHTQTVGNGGDFCIALKDFCLDHFWVELKSCKIEVVITLLVMFFFQALIL